jgi:uncharacterized membrane protein YhdT
MPVGKLSVGKLSPAKAASRRYRATLCYIFQIIMSWFLLTIPVYSEQHCVVFPEYFEHSCMFLSRSFWLTLFVLIQTILNNLYLFQTILNKLCLFQIILSNVVLSFPDHSERQNLSGSSSGSAKSEAAQNFVGNEKKRTGNVPRIKTLQR